ncbi:MAG: hypothetical protein N3I35_16310 [Clostridia bacterium]|nr:hypothetical protein [Clostridia bacterium]
MRSEYSLYLLYLFVVILLFSLFLFFLFRKKHKGNRTENRKSFSIASGNISIFFDKQENVTIIAYTADIFRVGRATGNPVFLNSPYSSEMLGQAARNAMSLSNKGLVCSDVDLMKMLGSREWKDFSRGRRNISMHYKNGHGVVLNSTVRKSDGSYQFNHMGFEKVISPDVSDIELGKTIKELLQRCR